MTMARPSTILLRLIVASVMLFHQAYYHNACQALINRNEASPNAQGIPYHLKDVRNLSIFIVHES